MLRRRDFLKLAVGAGVSSSFRVPHFSTEDLQVEEFTHELPKGKAPGLKLKIGFLTDLHFGPALPESILEKAVKKLNDAEVDIALLGGDLTWVPDSNLSKLFRVVRNKEFQSYTMSSKQSELLLEYTASFLNELKAPMGVYAVLGNHDRFLYSVKQCREILGSNLKVLINESVYLDLGDHSLELYGTDDYWTGRPRHLSPSKTPRICLSHNPDFIEESLLGAPEWFDLALCGHTHGGQIHLPVLGALTYNIKSSRFKQGLIKLKNSAVYTSRGLGVVEIPYRLNCTPELTIVEMKGF
jgi:hypothetical protein